MLVQNVQFAPPLANPSYWPILTTAQAGREIAYVDVNGRQHGAPSRSFYANRDNGARHHVAVDLWGNPGDPVVAVDDGVIVHFYPFYSGVFALLVQCKSNLVINYGEVAADSLSNLNLRVGDAVNAGQQIATIGRSTTGSAMCHFETYVTGTVSNQRWMAGESAPRALLNPTALLLALARSA